MMLVCRWRNTFIYNVNKVPIHVYTTRVLYREIYNLFMQALITVKKVGPWRCFFSCLAATFISTDTVHMLCLSCQNNCKNVWKSRINRHYNRCQSCVNDVHAYTVTVSYHCSTWIRYQKMYLLISDHIQHQIPSQCTLTAHISTIAELITLWHDDLFCIQQIC